MDINTNKLKNFFDKKEEYRVIGRDALMNAGVIILFCEMEGETYILFEKRAANIRQGGEICFPGGKRDKKDKDFLDTALRETYEEIGIPRERIKNTKKYGALILPVGIVVEASIGYIENFSMDELKLNKDEVEEIILVPVKFFLGNQPDIEYVIVENQPYYIDKSGKKIRFEAEKWGLPEKYTKPWSGNPRRIIVYVYEGDVIWGITGEIIYNIAREIEADEI